MTKISPSLDFIPTSLGAFIRDIEKNSLIPEELCDLPEYAEGGDVHRTYKAFYEMRKILEMDKVQKKFPEITGKYLKHLQLPEAVAFSGILLSGRDKEIYHSMEKTAIRELIDTRFGGTKLAMDAIAEDTVTIRAQDKAAIRNHVIQKMGNRIVRLNGPKIEQTYKERDYFSFNEGEIGALFHYVNAMIMSSGNIKTGRVFGFVLIKLLLELRCLESFPEHLVLIRACLPEEILHGALRLHTSHKGKSYGIIEKILTKIRSIVGSRV